ncbi:DUF3108 domain-containing protein [Ideonella sp.]|uniref:DUF3108 domain-containing protein n=1 Tax=Ideonella sp. TaxID=1929293 RepID=UPI003BB7E061
MTLALISRQPLSEQPRALALVGVVVVLAHLAVLEWRWTAPPLVALPELPLTRVMSVRTLALGSSPRADASESAPAETAQAKNQTTTTGGAGNPTGQAEGQAASATGDTVVLSDRPDAPTPLAEMAAPPALRLNYLAQRGTDQGSALLDWAPDDQGQYTLTWQVMLPGRPAVDWLSRGELGAQGVSPLRMVERRQGRDKAAVNFQRDKGIVSFSGSSRSFDLPPGAQDRASWLMQLPLLAQAAERELSGGASLALPMATVRGEVLLWRFEVVEQATLTLPSGQTLSTWHLLREPERPYDLRIEVWLAAEHRMLPVQLRMAVQPGEAPLTLSLLGELPESTRTRRVVADPGDPSSDPAAPRTP